RTPGCHHLCCILCMAFYIRNTFSRILLLERPATSNGQKDSRSINKTSAFILRLITKSAFSCVICPLLTGYPAKRVHIREKAPLKKYSISLLSQNPHNFETTRSGFLFPSFRKWKQYTAAAYGGKYKDCQQFPVPHPPLSVI